jgi:protein-tyrosine phosphatase
LIRQGWVHWSVKVPMSAQRAWRGIITSLDGHVARQVTGRMCREYDLILTMEKRHIHALCDIAPEMRGKVMLFGHWDNEREIPDPYRKSHEAFEAVYTLLDQSAQQWAQALKAQQG